MHKARAGRRVEVRHDAVGVAGLQAQQQANKAWQHSMVPENTQLKAVLHIKCTQRARNAICLPVVSEMQLHAAMLACLQLLTCSRQATGLCAACSLSTLRSHVFDRLICVRLRNFCRASGIVPEIHVLAANTPAPDRPSTQQAATRNSHS
jgi:hypothetical protein